MKLRGRGRRTSSAVSLRSAGWGVAVVEEEAVRSPDAAPVGEDGFGTLASGSATAGEEMSPALTRVATARTAVWSGAEEAFVLNVAARAPIPAVAAAVGRSGTPCSCCTRSGSPVSTPESAAACSCDECREGRRPESLRTLEDDGETCSVCAREAGGRAASRASSTGTLAWSIEESVVRGHRHHVRHGAPVEVNMESMNETLRNEHEVGTMVEGGLTLAGTLPGDEVPAARRRVPNSLNIFTQPPTLPSPPHLRRMPTTGSLTQNREPFVAGHTRQRSDDTVVVMSHGTHLPPVSTLWSPDTDGRTFHRRAGSDGAETLRNSLRRSEVVAVPWDPTAPPPPTTPRVTSPAAASPAGQGRLRGLFGQVMDLFAGRKEWSGASTPAAGVTSASTAVSSGGSVGPVIYLTPPASATSAGPATPLTYTMTSAAASTLSSSSAAFARSFGTSLGSPRAVGAGSVASSSASMPSTPSTGVMPSPLPLSVGGSPTRMGGMFSPVSAKPVQDHAFEDDDRAEVATLDGGDSILILPPAAPRPSLITVHGMRGVAGAPDGSPTSASLSLSSASASLERPATLGIPHAYRPTPSPLYAFDDDDTGSFASMQPPSEAVMPSPSLSSVSSVPVEEGSGSGGVSFGSSEFVERRRRSGAASVVSSESSASLSRFL
ncbi:hypothetical protein HDU96_006674 [Phlyctochytrium bullatum]|nr:hypothetical protein HDU96_006674 [Phlyctochytrium bullatum]